MLIAIASTRPPKVQAVKQTFQQLAPLLNRTFTEMEFLATETASGVGETPTSIDQLLGGARTRALKLLSQYRDRGEEANYFIGLEGGLFSLADGGDEATAFLQSWAFVTDGELESFGSSGAVPVPVSIARAVLAGGQSLGVVIDLVAQQRNVRSKQGTWGILTRDLVSRQNSFELAVLNAMAPFYNKTVYQISSPAIL